MKLKTMNKLIAVSVLTLSPTTSKAESVYMCEPCPAGYSCNNGVKTPCPAGTFAYAGAISCIPCADGTYSNEGSSSCSSVCLKNDYSILTVSYSGNVKARNVRCNTSFSSRTFSAGTKADDKSYGGRFPTSRSFYYCTHIQWVQCGSESGANCQSCDCVYNGTVYSSIKFHYNSDKNKIEVITNTGSVIAELEATMCN